MLDLGNAVVLATFGFMESYRSFRPSGDEGA
jgi:hypothetical protein